MTSFDVVVPNNNEQELVDTAIALGYKELVFLTSNSRYVAPKSEKIVIKKAYLLKDPSEIAPARNVFDYLFAPAERKFFESEVDYIIDSELSDRKDSFHYRNTSLNQVHAKLARDNDIRIVFSFRNLLLSPLLTLGRMLQNSNLTRKYRLATVSLSMARKPSEMRSRSVLDALAAVLGL
jgi:hypothetical protein